MKKIVCLFVLLSMCFTLYAFDRSLIGSWGLIMEDNDKEEVIRFGQNEMAIFDMVLRPGDFETATDTIFIENLDGDSVIIQYYPLAPNKLLFIMSNTDNPMESLTLILSRL